MSKKRLEKVLDECNSTISLLRTNDNAVKSGDSDPYRDGLAKGMEKMAKRVKRIIEEDHNNKEDK